MGIRCRPANIIVADLIVICAMFLGIASHASPDAQYKFIVSSGALIDSDAFHPFYNSRVFKRDEEATPLVIENATVVAYMNEQAVFFSLDGFDPNELSEEATSIESGVRKGFLGHSYRGLTLSHAEIGNKVRWFLGADTEDVQYEKRTISGKEIIAFNKSNTQKQEIRWPKVGDPMVALPAVVVKDESGLSHVVVARLVGSLAHRLGLLDRLLSDKAQETGFIELGSDREITNSVMAREALNSILARKPQAIYAGTSEMTLSLLKPDLVKEWPILAPFGDNFHSSVPIGAKGDVNFFALSGDERIWPLLAGLGQRVSVPAGISSMKAEESDPRKSLNIVKVFSEDAARAAAKSVYVDLVLLLASDPFSRLPSEESIELNMAQSDAYDQLAPIVRISYLDLAEVQIFGPNLGTISRVKVIRHPIDDDGPLVQGFAQDKASLKRMGLLDLGAIFGDTDRPWVTDDLQKVLGGIILKETNADVAIFEKFNNTTPIKGAIPLSLSKSLLSPHGSLVSLMMTGKQLKEIAKLNNGDRFYHRYVFYGIDDRANRQGGRPVNDREKFRVAMSESALLEFFGLSMVGGLSEAYAIRAPFVEAIYGDVRQLFFVGGPKVAHISDAADEARAVLDQINSAKNFDDLLSEFFANAESFSVRDFILNPTGKPHHVITLDIAYMDIGISTNFANDVYKGHVKDFPISRGKIPLSPHLFLYTKSSLNYDAPELITTLSFDVKYMHTDLKGKPEKDKTKLGLRFRLPWERSFFDNSSVVLSPVFNNVYETKLAPHFLSHHDMLPERTKRIDSLLGVNMNFARLGFNIDVGPVMATDFNRYNFSDAVDYGPGLNFYGKWSLFGPLELSSEITSYYLFALPKNRATDKIALGVDGAMWLRVARFHDFSLAVLNDFLIATLQRSKNEVSVSSILGLTVSYGRLFRLLG